MMNGIKIGKPRGRHGFTLSELLVAITLSMIVAVAVFRGLSVHSTTSRYTAEAAEVWERLSLAATMITTEAQASAWGGTPYSPIDTRICPKPPSMVYRGLVIDDGEAAFADAESLDAGNFGLNVNVDPDQCIFQSAVELVSYQPISISGDTLDFTGVPGLPSTETAFEVLFTGHSLVIESDADFAQIVDVTAVDFDARTVTVSPNPVQAVGEETCGYQGTGDEEDVFILTNVRYRIIEDPNDEDGTLLIREELQPDLSLPTIIDGTRLVISEDIVDLQCWVDGLPTAVSSFRTDGRIVGSYYGDDDGTLTAAQAGPASTEVQRGRVFHFQITGRTRREFDILAFNARDVIASDGLDLMKRWDIDGNADNAALAQTLAGQTELSNFVMRNLQ